MADIFATMARVPEVAVRDAADLDRHLREASAPFVVRGLIADWPLVRAARESAETARAHLLAHHRDLPFPVSVGQPGGDGRLFYDDAMRMNFAMARAKLPDIFAELVREEEAATPRPLYLASIDLRGHPRFRDALNHAQTADLEAGDAIFIPALWWHHVEGLAAFNILVNYWWRDTPRWLGVPQDAMNHAILAVREPQRNLGQFDRHRVLIDAVDAALEHHSTDDVPVV